MIIIKRSFINRLPSSLPYNLLRLTTIGLSLFLFSAQLFNAFFSNIGIDDAMWAITAKNLAIGQGYSAVFFDQNYPFHFTTTLGPILLLPTSLMILIFGNHHWIPSITAILLIWTLIFFIFITTYDLFSRDKRWLFYFLNLLLAILLLTNNFNENQPENNPFIFWYSLRGEIISSLLLILGILLLLKTGLNCNRIPFKKIFLSGFVLGLAMLSKISTVIGIAAILCFIFCRVFFVKSFNKSEKIKLILILSISAFTPLILFELTKLIYFGFDQYIYHQSQLLELYKHNYLLTKERINAAAVTKFSIYNNLLYLVNFFGYSVFLIIPTTTYILYLSLKETHNNPNVNKIAIITLSCFLLYITCWICFSFGNLSNYLITAIAFYIFSISLLISNIYYKNIRFLTKIYIIFFLILLLSSRANVVKYFALNLFKNNQSLEEYSIVVKAIDEARKQGAVLISCGNNFELEYLLPNSNNFKDCSEVLKSSSKTEKILLVNHFNINHENTSIIRPKQNYNSRKKIPDSILTRCNETYLKTEKFTLNWCIE